MEIEERKLIARAKGDPEAFGELYERYVSRIYSYHYRHTSNRTEAEDLTSRTFYRALRSLQGFREGGAPFQAWLFRIAHNLVVNWYRDHSRHQTISLDGEAPLPLPSQSVNPESYVLSTEMQRNLLERIESLPEDRKTLIILKFVEHLTNAEIGEVLGRTEGAVKALYYRTLVGLRQAMQEGAGDVQEIQ